MDIFVFIETDVLQLNIWIPLQGSHCREHTLCEKDTFLQPDSGYGVEKDERKEGASHDSENHCAIDSVQHSV